METKWSLCISYFLCWCIFCSLHQTLCFKNETDRLALISFKESIQRGALSSWNESLHFCDWYGVSCSRKHPDRIIALNLISQGLAGWLSPHLGNLSFLRHINLRNNTFHGRIPHEIGRLRRLRYINLSNNSFQGTIPANLTRCSNLVYLNIIDNKLVGGIPAELGSLSKLEALGLARNNLTGIIPSSFGNLSFLRQTSLDRNGLEGQIPEEISQLGSLKYFVASNNFLSGAIPHGIFNISSLVQLGLDSNRLQGIIPSDIGLTLPELISVSYADNNLSGSIPISLSNASKLELIVGTGNHFTGLIPRDLGKLPNLRIVEFHLNQLKDDLSFIDSLTNCSELEGIGIDSNFLWGSIPMSVANLSKHMKVFDLAQNELHGAIPVGVENLFNLQSLMLEVNHLSGSIQINFEKFQELEILTLHHNKLTGAVPSSIGNLSKLSILYLDYNNLNGSIPPSLGSCSNLIELYLSYNNLTGSIPKEVLGLSSLPISLDLAGNALSGPIPSEIGLLQHLAELDFSDNSLSGMIPISISKCSSLEQLYLQGNSLEGEIPQVLSYLQGLQRLDISRNKFSGPIPKSLAELDGLFYLNMSCNQLQGEVPKNGVFQNASAVSLLGNNGLCGGIAEFKIQPCINSPNSKKNNISLAVKVATPTVVIVVLLVCFLILRYRKKNSSEKNTSLPSFGQQLVRISYAQLFKATNGFSAANILGVGSYGSVYKITLEQIGTEAAVKVLNLQRRGASSSFISECQVLGGIRHRNLLKILSVCSSIDFAGNDFKALVYEFMANGSLETWLHSNDGRNLKLIQRLNIASDVASGIEYLHNGSSSRIIHGDVKPSNVLLDDEMIAHIGDFGLAKIVSSISDQTQSYGSTTSTAIKGSIGYVAPEYGMGVSVSAQGDVYSYGILLLEMFTGRKPTDENFKDDLDLHTFVERSLNYNMMEIELEEETISKNCIMSALRIGVACSMEQPGDRMEMKDVIRELRRVKDSYQVNC